MKKNGFFAIALVFVMLFALSAVSYADAPVVDGSRYKMALLTDTIIPGTTEVTAKVVLIDKNNPDGTVDITGNANSSISVEFDCPSEGGFKFIADSLVLKIDGAAIESSEIDDSYFMATFTVRTSVKLAKDTVICEIGLSVPADIKEGTYDFSADGDYNSVIDGATGDSTGSIDTQTSSVVVKADSTKAPVLTFEGVEGTYKTDENGKLEGTVPTPDAKEGYTFAGWAVKGTTDVVDFATSTFSEDTTFVALWTKNHVAADKGTEYAEVKAYDDGFYYEGRYFFIANDDTVTNYGVSIKGAKDTKDFIGKNKVEGAAKVLYRIALLGDDAAALKAIVATPFINK